MKTKLLLSFFIVLTPFLVFGQTLTGPGGSFNNPGVTSGVIEYTTSTGIFLPGTTLAGMCPNGEAVDVPPILGYNVQITNITLINAQHTFASDLDLRLIAPDGTIITFNTDNGGSTGLDAASDVCFDITAANCADAWTSSGSTAQPEDCLVFETTENTCGPLMPPFTFVCGENTASIDGAEANGTWTLQITDDAGGDTGSFASFSITFAPMTPPTVDSNGLAIDLLTCCVGCDAEGGSFGN